jgi:hypothetical protein
LGEACLALTARLFGFAMRLMLTAERAKLLEFETLSGCLLILGIAVIPSLALVAL